MSQNQNANEAKGFYKLSWIQRIGFGSGDMAQNLIYQTVSIWLLADKMRLPPVAYYPDSDVVASFLEDSGRNPVYSWRILIAGRADKMAVDIDGIGINDAS